jgi:hypothetical protein
MRQVGEILSFHRLDEGAYLRVGLKVTCAGILEALAYLHKAAERLFGERPGILETLGI